MPYGILGILGGKRPPLRIPRIPISVEDYVEN